MKRMSLYVGTCGLPKSIKTIVKTLDCVEIQESFYKLLGENRIKRWYDSIMSVRSDFKLCFKAPQYITHPPNSPTYKRGNLKINKNSQEYGYFKMSSEVMGVWDQFYEIISKYNAAAVVFQTPLSYLRYDPELANARAFFRHIKKGNIEYYWEIRGMDKYGQIRSIAKDIMNECNIYHAIDPFNTPPIYTRNIYFRLHGSPPGKRMYYYRYSDNDIKTLTKVIEDCINKNIQTIYVMFNNIYMYNDAVRLKKFLNENVIS